MISVPALLHDFVFRYATEVRRYFYVTPTSYLELLRSFKDLLVTKRNEVILVQERCAASVFPDLNSRTAFSGQCTACVWFSERNTNQAH